MQQFSLPLIFLHISILPTQMERRDCKFVFWLTAFVFVYLLYARLSAMMREDLFPQGENWLNKTEANTWLSRASAVSPLTRQIALSFQLSTCYKKWRTLCSFELWIFHICFVISAHLFPFWTFWTDFSCSNWLFGWTGTWKEALKCSLAMKKLLIRGKRVNE